MDTVMATPTATTRRFRPPTPLTNLPPRRQPDAHGRGYRNPLAPRFHVIAAARPPAGSVSRVLVATGNQGLRLVDCRAVGRRSACLGGPPRNGAAHIRYCPPLRLPHLGHSLEHKPATWPVAALPGPLDSDRRGLLAPRPTDASTGGLDNRTRLRGQLPTPLVGWGRIFSWPTRLAHDLAGPLGHARLVGRVGRLWARFLS